MKRRKELNPTQPRKISDYIKPQAPFYPEAQQFKIDTLVDIPIVIKDTRLIPELSSTFDDKKHEGILFAFYFTGGEEEIKTCLAGQDVLVKRLKELQRRRAFPVEGKIIQVPTKVEGQFYYDIVDAS